MFCGVNLEPPHQTAFKCSPDEFAALVERPGVRPAPYLARAMWVHEEALGESLDRRELERLLRTAYDLVRTKLPKSKQAAIGRRQRSTAAKRRSGKKRR